MASLLRIKHKISYVFTYLYLLKSKFKLLDCDGFLNLFD